MHCDTSIRLISISVNCGFQCERTIRYVWVHVRTFCPVLVVNCPATHLSAFGELLIKSICVYLEQWLNVRRPTFYVLFYENISVLSFSYEQLPVTCILMSLNAHTWTLWNISKALIESHIDNNNNFRFCFNSFIFSNQSYSLHAF